MNIKILKVAIAIGGLWNDRCNPCTNRKIIKCEECLNAAKAAINAMSKPTNKMIEAGNKASYDNSYIEIKAYNAMIKAALK